MLQQKVGKLEKLLALKDQRIEELSARLRGAGIRQ
jgi:hypothetical protein